VAALAHWLRANDDSLLKMNKSLSGLTAAEQRLMDAHDNGNGRGAELLKQLRSHLVVAGKAMLDTLVRDATGAQPVSVHHDISPTTGEEVLVFTLSAAPQCRGRNDFNDRRRR
jgi:uncharacterized protein YbcI